MECIISLIFHVEGEFGPYAGKFLPVLLQFIPHPDWSTKKVAIDAIYSMAAILKEEIEPYRATILKVLNHCRFDKVKPVRDATLETIKLIKEMGPPIDEDQLSTNDPKSTKSKKLGRSGSTSARIKRGQSFTEGSNSDEGILSTKSTNI